MPRRTRKRLDDALDYPELRKWAAELVGPVHDDIHRRAGEGDKTTRAS